MILNGRVINPGELSTRVQLAPRVMPADAGGFRAPAPDMDRAVGTWARWTNAHGSEIYTAQAAGVTALATVLVRFRADLDATWYISNDNGASWYEIVSLDDIANRHEYIELKVRLWKAG